MAQPPDYTRAFSFTNYTANYPSTPQPGVRLDTEFDALSVTTDAIRANLALIQRDDGALANASVGADQLSPEITMGLRSIREWATATAYIVNDAVWRNGLLYRCLISHTAAASFTTDLTAVRWILIYDLSLAVPAAVNAAIAAGTIVVGVDTSNFAALNGANAFSGANTFSNTNTFSVAPPIKVAVATTAGIYHRLEPTDYGVGKPRVLIQKRAAVNEWELTCEDSVGTDGIFDMVGSIRINGAVLATATEVDALTTKVRRARNLALALR
jgi:hypothetical protein